MSEAQEQPTSPKPNTKQPSEKPKKSIFKKTVTRGLLSAMALSSAATSTTVPGDTLKQIQQWQNYPPIVRELSLPDLENRVETLYQIQIVSPQEVQEINVDNERLKTLEWDKETIGQLITDLDQLPPHFYHPAPSVYEIYFPKITKPEGYIDEQWRKIEQKSDEQMLNTVRKDLGQNFNLSREEFEKAKKQGFISHNVGVYPAEFFLVHHAPKQNEKQGWMGFCICSAYIGNITPQSKVSLDKRLFEREFRQDRFSTVAHELIHRITRHEDQEFVANLLDFPIVEQNNMKKLIEPKTNLDAVRKRFGDSVANWLDHGNDNTLEFLGIGGAFYLQGRERFLEIYEEFMGEKKSEKFYEYMRDNIFKGQEYSPKGNK